ncbi:MAG: DNA polymerase/3'-5' exonuclease PolX [Gammaproteobacteria bacterium]|nr:DNA polymerase/3'-5' exonuclease PolX [Gammaproteobacteria bacterium]
MPAHNAEIAALFDRLADLLEIEDANPFRVRAYRNAARTIANLGQSIAGLVETGKDLSELPGIGEAIAEKIATIVRTGRLPQLEEVEARTPGTLADLMKIDGLGPKRVKALYRQLNIRSFEDLARAARSGKIRGLDGFGAKTEAMILQHVEHRRGAVQRMRLAEAEDIAGGLVDYLRKSPGVKDISVAGSIRRRKDTVGDLDILVTAARGSPVMRRFVAYDEVADVISQGDTRSTVVLRSGLHADLRVVPQVSFGAALCYFTGSKAHNIAVRKIGVAKGCKVNEYGVFKGEKRVAGRTEQDVYAKLGLAYIEPEMREDRGEIELAAKGRLPKLVTLDDIRGDLHCHTDLTDGRNTLEEMAAAAGERGYEYLAVTDHTKHVTVAHGLDKAGMMTAIRRIDRLNTKLDGITILKSAEVDILEDGRLDLPDSVLRELDLVVCAVHYKFNLPEKKQTARILRALDNRHCNILAHPGGRLINVREPYEVDMQTIMNAARERGCFLELNAQPARLDLTDVHCKMAKDMGLKVAISTDAHNTAQFDYMRFGIGQARRGWLEARDVLNTRGLVELKKLLRRD